MQKAHEQRRPGSKQLGSKGIGTYLKEPESGENNHKSYRNGPIAGHKKRAKKPQDHDCKTYGKGPFNAEAPYEHPAYKAENYITQRQEGNHYPLLFVGSIEFHFYKGESNPLEVFDKAEKQHGPKKDNEKQYCLGWFAH